MLHVSKILLLESIFELKLKVFDYLDFFVVLNKLTTFTGQPFGFLRVCGKSLLLYSRQFSSLIASSNVMVTICGTSVGDNPPGTRVPSLEHQQSGSVQLL